MPLNSSGCSEPMGMKSGHIQDYQITASSIFRTLNMDMFTWEPGKARLDKQGKVNAWTSGHSDQSQWLQVGLIISVPICLGTNYYYCDCYCLWMIKCKVEMCCNEIITAEVHKTTFRFQMISNTEHHQRSKRCHDSYLLAPKISFTEIPVIPSP